MQDRKGVEIESVGYEANEVILASGEIVTRETHDVVEMTHEKMIADGKFFLGGIYEDGVFRPNPNHIVNPHFKHVHVNNKTSEVSEQHLAAFAKWVKDATNVELDRLLTALVAAPTSEVGDEEIRMLHAEIDARMTRENESRDEFFPRVTFRESADARMMGELLESYALNILEQMQHVRIANHMHEMGLLTAHFVQPDGVERATAEVLSEYTKRCIRAADLLGAVRAELMRLNAGESTGADKEYGEKFASIVERLKTESEGN